MHAVVLLSGGLDSATALAICRDEGYEPHALSFRYGQRHDVELQSASAVARAAGISQYIVEIPDLGALGGSALTGASEVPKHESVDELDSTEVAPTYVPARNTIFLSFALAYAEVLGADDIYIGVNALDYSGYPDCRPEFIEAFAKMAALATGRGVAGNRLVIHVPLITLSKAQIIERGLQLGVDYSLTHSCYDPQPVTDRRRMNVGACGHCDSCLLRLKGFAENGVEDPIRYAQTA